MNFTDTATTFPLWFVVSAKSAFIRVHPRQSVAGVFGLANNTLSTRDIHQRLP